MEGTPKRLLIVDGTNIFWRAYHGLIHQHFEFGGNPTWGVFGSLNTISTAIKNHHITHVVVAFDWGKSEYRKAIWPEYKAGRVDSTGFVDFDDAHNQMSQTILVLTELGIKVWRDKGVEADDIIGSVAVQMADKMDEILVYSGDKDMRQLVSRKTVLIHPSLGKKGEERWDIDRVIDHYGVTPDRLPEVWALSGDKVDNIPGVPGVGEKTAIKLIKKYGDLSAVSMSGEPKLAGHLSDIHMSHKLVEINPTLSSFNCTPDEILFKPIGPHDPDAEKVRETLKRNGFDVILSRWSSGTLWSERGVRLRDLKHNG